MRNRFVRSFLFSVLVTVSVGTTIAQQGGRGQAGAGPRNALGRGAPAVGPPTRRYSA